MKVTTSVKLSNLKLSFDSFCIKNELEAVKSSMKDWLSEKIKSSKIFKSFVQNLNSEGWKCEKISWWLYYKRNWIYRYTCRVSV